MMKHIAVIGLAMLLVGGLTNAAQVDGDYPGERYVLEITKVAGVGSVECLDRYEFAIVDQGSGLAVTALEVDVQGPSVHHEQFDFGGRQTTPKLSTMVPTASPIDTTMLVDWGDVPGYEAAEPAVDSSTSTEPSSGTFPVTGITGYGAPLTGTVFSTGEATPLDVLQVVIKCGTAADYRVSVSNGAGEGETFEGIIPEPPTLGLLCLGGLALIRRRR
jgi:hypothetical protein